MNKVVLAGRLGADIELRYTAGEKPLAIGRGSVAVARPTKEDKKNVEWINFTMFGDKAENLEKYAHKGNKIILDGELRHDSYEKQGVKINTLNFIANSFELCEPKPVASGKKEDDPATWQSVPDFN